MTSSSSLYGTVTTQNSSSSNSTSLYGEAGTPIPDSSGNVVVRGDLYVLSGNILTTANTGNIFPANATTVNLGLAATAVNIGAASGTTTINNDLVVNGTFVVPGAEFGNITIGVADDNTITTTTGNLKLSSATGEVGLVGADTLFTDTTGTFLLLNAPTTIYAFDSATTLELGDVTGTTTVRNNLVAGGSVTGDSGDFANITIGVATDNTITTTSGDLAITATGSNGVEITSGTAAPTLITRNTGNTNTSTRTLALAIQSSGTPAVGFGNTLDFQIEAQSGNTEQAGFINVVSTDLTPDSEDFSMGFGLMQNGSAYTTKMILDSTGSLAIDNNLTVGGVNINMAPSTNFLYSENNDRANRPEVQSISGDSSGFRVRAPNATANATSTLSVNNSSDSANTEFLAIQARGSALTNTFRILTGEYIANVATATNKSVAFVDNTNTYATVNPAGPTIGTDLTTKTYVDALVAGSGVTSITGTANQVIASSPTGAVTLSLPQSIATTSTPTFAGATLDAITIGVATANTITTTTGDLNITAAAASNVNITSETNAATSITRNTVNTTGNSRSLTLAVQSSGTPTVGFGNSLEYQVEAQPGNTESAGFIAVTSTDLTVGSEDFSMRFGLMQAGAASDAKMVLDSTGSLSIDNDLTVGGTAINIAQAADILYSEDNNRLNRPNFQSTTGNTSGMRAIGPNATPSAVATISAFSSSDLDNGSFINIQARNSGANPLRVQTGLYTGGTVGPSGTSLAFVDNATVYATVNPAGPTIGTDLTTKSYVDGLPDLNTTYTIDASSTTGGANLNLVGSDSTTDTVKIASGTGVTVAQTSANELSVAIGQSVATTADVTFNTVNANLTDDNYVLGQLYATRNTAWTPPPVPLTTLAGQNGIYAVSSGNGAGYAPAIQAIYYSGDTTAGVQASAAFAVRGANGTNSAPTAASINQVMGTMNYDGYGTTNWANTIASVNQGAGTASITPLQAQGYARQTFVDSGAVTTTVTGASGTGSVATLTFTLQNTAPYVVGQSVTIAGMTPSGYNGTYILTAATTSSISYANATTGFTSGGTIAATRTVTAAGMGFRVRGFANSTNLSVANRFNFMDLTASAATFKSATYTFANEVITGSTLTATNYLTLASTGANFVGAGAAGFNRTGAVAANVPGLTLRYSRTDQTGPQDNDGIDFRLGVGGTSTFANVARFDCIYKSSGDNEIGMTVSADSFTADTDRIYVGSRASTTIRTTPVGGGTTANTAEFTQLATTIKTDSVVLQTAAGVALVGNKISYNRVFGQWQHDATITPAVADTAYAVPFQGVNSTIDFANIASTTNTSRIQPNALGMYKLQFSAQVQNSDNAQEHEVTFWWRKNGTDISNSAGYFTVPKASVADGALIVGWDNMVEVTTITDYYELMYAVSDIAVTLPFIAAAAPRPGAASVFLTLIPVGA